MQITKIERHPTHPDRFLVETVGTGCFQLKAAWTHPAGFHMGKVTNIEEEVKVDAEVLRQTVQAWEDFLDSLEQSEVQATSAAARFVRQRLETCGDMPSEAAKLVWWLVDVLPLSEHRLAMLKVKGVESKLQILLQLMTEMRKQLELKGVPPASDEFN